MQQIVLASTNEGKIREFSEIFRSLQIEIIPQSKFNVPDCDEPYYTFVENALHKARHCNKYTQLPSLADDSGLCVAALNGAPGVFSARYATNIRNDTANNQKLLAALNGIENRQAYLYCVLVLVQNQNDPQPLIYDGILKGTIIDHSVGENGFGYSPYFYLDQYKKTLSQLEISLRNQISHRAQAIKKLLKGMTYES